MENFLNTTELAARELPALCKFAAGAKVPAGFGYLSADGKVLPEYGAQLWINCRMTHMFSLFALAGINTDMSRELAEYGVHAISEYFYDHENGGWFSYLETELDSRGKGRPNLEKAPRKEAYAHAFVMLAASSATVAEISGARELLEAARDIHDAYWWDEVVGRVCESYAPDWSASEQYRGANANMHTTEACLAAYDATGDVEYLRRAALITNAIINNAARSNGWRIPEHFTADWHLDLDYNKDKPTDPFRPWGATPGHGFEWARLLLHLKATVQASELEEKLGADVQLDWVEEAAEGLYRVALESWGSDGTEGIPYTTDFEGRPVSSQRMHWVACEGLGVSQIFARYFDGGSGEKAAELTVMANEWARRFSEYSQEYLIEAPGRWWHELDAHNQPAEVTWPGKADIYHAGQAMFLATLPVTPGFAAALKG
ncbi:MAG: AGE family epimerase/isomerase [Actinomycetaceae bacterium]|nr:AGE family epimerase/isomerase [Actinomycetaceae bacterium]